MESLATSDHHQQSINLALDYVHAFLPTNLQLETVASIANLSAFHFHRIFKEEVGEPLDQYIRRLRLERAAMYLQVFSMTLHQIAQKCGYRTEQSLSKAFKKYFGESPREYRKKSIYPLKALPSKESPHQQLSPQIIESRRIHLVYLRIVGKYGNSSIYDAAWQKLLNFVSQNDLLTADTAFLGLSLDDPSIAEDAKCRFYACATTFEKKKPKGAFGSLTLQAGSFAVFTLAGSYEHLNELYQLIYLKWLPESRYKLRPGLPFEKYLNSPDEVSQEDLLTEVWIPVTE